MYQLHYNFDHLQLKIEDVLIRIKILEEVITIPAALSHTPSNYKSQSDLQMPKNLIEVRMIVKPEQGTKCTPEKNVKSFKCSPKMQVI